MDRGDDISEGERGSKTKREIYQTRDPQNRNGETGERENQIREVVNDKGSLREHISKQ